MITKEKKQNDIINTTKELIERMQSGDAFAFNELYDTTKQYVTYSVMKAGVTGADVEDVVQEVYIKIFNKYDTCNNTQGALSWIKRISFNTATDYLRKNSHETLTNCEEDEFVFEESELVAPMEMPEDVMENAETQRLIAEIINKLPENQQIVVTAFYFDEMKTREIAEAYGIPEGTVKTNLYKARKTIEEEVRLLAEKHGTKLFTIAFVPFMGLLFAKEAFACSLGVETTASVFEAAVLGSKANALGVSAVYEAGGAAVEGATVATSTTVGVTSAASTATASTTVGTGATATATTATATAAGTTAGTATATGTAAAVGGVIGKAVATKVIIGVVTAGAVAGGGVAVANTVSEQQAATTDPSS